MLRRPYFWLGFLFFGSLFGLVSIVQGQPFSTPYAVAFCPLTGCTYIGAVTFTSEVNLNEGSESIGDFDTVCSVPSVRPDLDGLQSCGPLTDAAPAAVNISSRSAAPLATGANQTGANLVLRPGSGTHKAVMTAASFVNNTTTFTFTIDGTANTGTEGTAFECDSVTNTVCANNIANWIEGLAGAAGGHACSSGSTTTCTTFGFTGVAGTAYFFPAPEDSPGKFIDSIACSTGAAATLTNGTNGAVTLPDGTAAAPMLTFVADPDTGIYRSQANGIGFASNGAAVACIGTSCSAGTVRIGTLSSTILFGTSGECSITQGILSCGGQSAQLGLTQNQTGAFAVRIQSVADGAGEIGARIGTSIADGSITGTTTRLASFCTDCDGTPSEKAWVGNDGSVTASGLFHSDSVTTLSLDAATTVAATRNVHVLDCVGAETLTTITGGLAGAMLTLIFFDADACTITDDATCAANSINVSAAYVSTADDTLTLVSNGTCWREVSRAVN